MAKSSKSGPEIKPIQLTHSIDNLPVIYADRVINAGFGPVVCKLTLAMEAGKGIFSPTATLILPTPSLIDAMNAVFDAFQGNPEVKKGLLAGLDAIKEQLIKQN